MMALTKKRLVTTALIWFGVIMVIRVFSLFKNISFIDDNLPTITAILLVYPPVLISLFNKQRIQCWQFAKTNLIFSLKIVLIVSVIIFPASFLVNHFFQKMAFGRGYGAGPSDLWFLYAMSQLFIVAFPEEFFFRGFLQESLNKVFVPQKKFFLVPFGLSQMIVASVFALSHSLIHWQWWHFSIFFPALVFGWLKEKTQTIWAAVAFHALCNVFSFWVSLHYR